jgi:hypothetical protein
MLSKKLIGLFIAIATVSAVSAHYNDNCYVDRYGNEQCGFKPVEETADVAGRAVEGTEDVAFGAVGGLFGGRGPVERVQDRRADRQARREQKRAERQARQ